MRLPRVSRQCTKIRAATGVEGIGEIEEYVFLCSKVVVVVTSDMDADAITQTCAEWSYSHARLTPSMAWLLDLNAACAAFTTRSLRIAVSASDICVDGRIVTTTESERENMNVNYYGHSSE